MSRAKELLKKNISVLHVCFEVGFSSPTSFAGIFKKHVGLSPSRFQEREKSLYDAGIPLTAFQVENVDEEYQRLLDLGVKFSMQPTVFGPTKLAVLDDTCGNNIQLFQTL
jgi:hypothetical protein